jgi:hypothetical protein
MKIKLSILLLFVSIIALSSLPSCSKDTVTVVKNDTTIIKDTFSIVGKDTSTLGLLTAKQWIMDSIYYNHNGAGTGTLVYARGRSNNTVNADGVRVVFWMDGSEDNFSVSGTYLPLQWSFVNGDSSEIYTPPYPTYVPNGDYGRIVKLDVTHLTLYDSTNSALDIFIYKP